MFLLDGYYKIEDFNLAKKHHFKLNTGLTKHRQAKVVIFGAGEAGRQLAVGLEQSHEYKLLAFVDDDINLHGRDLMGLPILSQSKLVEFVNQHQVDDILSCNSFYFTKETKFNY